MQAQTEQALTLARSCDLHLPVSVKIARLEGSRPKKTFDELLEDPAARLAGYQQDGFSSLYVAVQAWADNRPLTIPFYTPHKAFTSSYTWNLPMTLPLKYRDLPPSAQLTLTIYDVAAPPYPSPLDKGKRRLTAEDEGGFLPNSQVVGGTTLALFGKKHALRKGKQRCLIHKGRVADGSVFTSTPSKTSATANDKLGRLEKLVKRHQRGDLPALDWLDRSTFRQIERVHAEESARSEEMYLYVDLPRFDFPVVFSEPDYPPPSLPFLSTSAQQPIALGGPTATANVVSGGANRREIFTVVDPEVARENPVEAKHTRLHRSHRTGPLDRELRPEKSVRDELNAILNYPSTKALSRKDRDLVWRFRFFLTRESRALTKFLKSVVWSDPSESRQAVDVLLPLWCDVGVDDALELLGPHDAFREQPKVRGFAVRQLGRADDEELVGYLLQLVQALKFETPSGGTAAAGGMTGSSVAGGRSSRHSRTASSSRLASTTLTSTMTATGAKSASASASGLGGEGGTLEEFLIERAVKNAVLGNQFYWYLAVECEDKAVKKLYDRVAKRFASRLQETERGKELAKDLARQHRFMAELSRYAKEVRASKDSRAKKIDRLKSALRDARHPLTAEFGDGKDGFPLPLDARVRAVGMDAERATIFKSNLSPLRLCFTTTATTTEGGEEGERGSYLSIFKNGDDMRQDQLVIQLFALMDRLLRNEHLDLRLTPYRVLATGGVDGMVQFVPSMTLGEIVGGFGGSLLNYLRAENPDEGSVGTYGVAPAVLDNFIRSCAGYCVVTYLLGVGDRHLDNLLLCPDGRFFHVDFGYILGRDPKPFPPAVKVCKEMVDAMGGVHSAHYGRFKGLCFTAFTSLRKRANLIINLVALMVDANIPDIKLEPDKAVLKVQDKFRLDLSEEEAIKYFETLLNETSYLTAVFDRIHAVAMYWKS